MFGFARRFHLYIDSLPLTQSRSQSLLVYPKPNLSVAFAIEVKLHDSNAFENFARHAV